MKRLFSALAVLVTLVCAARPAYAWDDFGHRVVARIAWENMTPHARARAIAILRSAGMDTGLRGSASGTLSEAQQIELFVFAATWPDVVRDTAFVNANRMEMYHHPYRHYVDTFWRQESDFGPVLASDRRAEGDLLRDWPRMQTLLANGLPELKAIGLAWTLHLVGDIHQPLHASGRITPMDPFGDAGGNDFKLEIANPQDPPARQYRRSLHGLWDGIINANFRPQNGESEAARVNRAAAAVMHHHGRGEFSAALGEHEISQWARESVGIAQRVAYRPPLVRNQAAPAEYRSAAFAAAEPRVALAGYRLADLLNRVLGH